eukprot:5561370-Pleurochrysis_carterae.AAC.1
MHSRKRAHAQPQTHACTAANVRMHSRKRALALAHWRGRDGARAGVNDLFPPASGRKARSEGECESECGNVGEKERATQVPTLREAPA